MTRIGRTGEGDQSGANARQKSSHPVVNECPFFRVRHQLTIEDGILRLRTKCYIPLPLRKDVFDSCHELHTGIHSTANRILLTSWWPTLGKDVRSWVRNCPACSKLRPSFQKHLNSWPDCLPFERVHADWCHVPEVGDVLVMVDAGSGWIECSLPQSRTSSKVIDSLSAIFSRFGVPKTLVTDNGAEFTSREMNNFCISNGITKKETPPYHPASNGAAERSVQTIKNGMKAWRLEVAHVSFRDYMKRLLLHHRACFKRPDGRTPAEIVFGRQIRIPLARGFSFSEPIHLRSRDGALRDASYLLERGSNTSWVLDGSKRLRLAHHDQIAPRPTASSPSEMSEADPDSTLPMVDPEDTTPTPPRPRSPRPQRTRRKKVVTDYSDL